jgi:polyisoprenoid-binding protein YceI
MASVPRFEIDVDRSQVWLTARSSLHAIKATTSAVSGWLDTEVSAAGIDLSRPAHARLEVDLEHLATGNPLYDRELRHRVDTDRYPSIIGELTSLASADDDGRYLVTGDLSFHGVTRSVIDELEIRLVDESTIALGGTSSFDVRDFGLEPPKMLGFRVHPDVTVRVRIVAESAG